MLQVKTTETGFELKNSASRLSLVGEKIVLGEKTIDQPGEYESEGIEIVYGEQAVLIAWDMLQLVYVFDNNKPTSFEKAQFSPCDTIIFSQSLPSLSKSFFNETLEQYDPSTVLVSAKASIEEINSSFKSEPVESVKLSDQTIPEEGREFILLS